MARGPKGVQPETREMVVGRAQWAREESHLGPQYSPHDALPPHEQSPKSRDRGTPPGQRRVPRAVFRPKAKHTVPAFHLHHLVVPSRHTFLMKSESSRRLLFTEGMARKLAAMLVGLVALLTPLPEFVEESARCGGRLIKLC